MELQQSMELQVICEQYFHIKFKKFVMQICAVDLCDLRRLSCTESFCSSICVKDVEKSL